MGGFSGPMFSAIKTWVEQGCPCVARHQTYRYQVSYPNTVCVIFEKPTINGKTYDWACLDIHYTGGGAFQAVGGFWIRGLDDQDIKPEQDCKSPLRRTMYNNFKAAGPVVFPDVATLPVYNTTIQTLAQKASI